MKGEIKMFDNIIFDVNGIEEEDLLNTLKLAFKISGRNVEGWKIDNEKGLILFWDAENCNKLPTNLNAEQFFLAVVAFLKSEEAKNISCKDWDEKADHDGSNELGWRVYTEDWGMINGYEYSFLAVKPAYVWYGK
jgi:hypothetical protein